MTDNDQQVSVSRVIDAPPEDIFAVLTDPAQHPVIDGSGTVKATSSGDERLELGSKFGMKMRIGLPYRIGNTVVEYEPDRLIAWRHAGRHRWRYELEPVDGGTKVTETFDYSTALTPWAYEWAKIPDGHEGNIEATLDRLDTVVSE